MVDTNDNIATIYMHSDIFVNVKPICKWHCFECQMGLSQHNSPKSFTSLSASERSETSAEITHVER